MNIKIKTNEKIIVIANEAIGVQKFYYNEALDIGVPFVYLQISDYVWEEDYYVNDKGLIYPITEEIKSKLVEIENFYSEKSNNQEISLSDLEPFFILNNDKDFIDDRILNNPLSSFKDIWRNPDSKTYRYCPLMPKWKQEVGKDDNYIDRAFESGIRVSRGLINQEEKEAYDSYYAKKEAEAIKAEQLKKLTVTIGDGKVFYADAESRIDLRDAIELGIELNQTSTAWKLAEDFNGSRIVEVTIDELKEASKLALMTKGNIVGAI